MHRYFLVLIALLFFYHPSYGSDLFVPELQNSLREFEFDPPKESVSQAKPQEDSRISIRGIPKNFAKNLVGLFGRENFNAALIGVPASGIATAFDDDVEDYFKPRVHNNTAFANVGAVIGEAYVLIPTVGTLFILGQKSESLRFRSFSYALFQGYIVDAVATLGFKQATRRLRPDSSNKQSFPSGHASDFFMIATLLDRYYGHKAGFVGYGLASYVAASRLKKDVHWLSDVVAGATLGYIIGNTVSRHAGHFLGSERFALNPILAPARKEYGVSIAIRLP